LPVFIKNGDKSPVILPSLSNSCIFIAAMVALANLIAKKENADVAGLSKHDYQ
jgi:hypothetical protein